MPFCQITTYLVIFKRNTNLLFYSFVALDIQHVSQGAKIQMSAELCSFVEALGENTFPYFFQFMEAAHFPWPLDTCLPSSKPAILGRVLFILLSSGFLFQFFLPLLRRFVSPGSRRIIQDNLLVLMVAN